jgi:hypothetical protein
MERMALECSGVQAFKSASFRSRLGWAYHVGVGRLVMKRLWIVFAVLLGLVIVVPVAWWFVMVGSGPTAAGPSEDPVLTWNREHEGLIDNGAEHYLKAIELLHETAPEKWADHLGELPLLAEIAAWVESRGDILDAIRAGTEAEGCWFELTRQTDGDLLFPHLSGIRALAKFLAFRAHIARERRDIELLADTIVLMDRLARHALEQPILLQRIVGNGCASILHDELLAPFGWQDADAGALSRYSARARQVCTQHRSLAETLKEERDEYFWWYERFSSEFGFEAGLRMPRQRYHGEIDRRFDLLIRMAGEPVERRLDPRNALLAELGTLDAAGGQLAAQTAAVFASTAMRPMELDGRIVAMQRGALTALAVFERQREVGVFPESLAFLEGEEFMVDPYTGAPFLYRRTDEGFILYSAGVDRDDDGGAHDGRFGEQRSSTKFNTPAPPPDGDYVFWPMQDWISRGGRPVEEDGG